MLDDVEATFTVLSWRVENMFDWDNAFVFAVLLWWLRRGSGCEVAVEAFESW